MRSSDSVPGAYEGAARAATLTRKVAAGAGSRRPEMHLSTAEYGSCQRIDARGVESLAIAPECVLYFNCREQRRPGWPRAGGNGFAGCIGEYSHSHLFIMPSAVLPFGVVATLIQHRCINNRFRQRQRRRVRLPLLGPNRVATLGADGRVEVRSTDLRGKQACGVRWQMALLAEQWEYQEPTLPAEEADYLMREGLLRQFDPAENICIY